MSNDEKNPPNLNLLNTWQKLQNNSEIVYNKFPHLNCSVKTRQEVGIFKEFCSFYGSVLDVGCGPNVPSYLQDNSKIEVSIGIDPLISFGRYESDGKITLMRAIGEHLPFQDNSFDFVCFATSFDHVIEPISVFNETKRVLKKNGIAIFWIDDDQPNLIKRALRKTKQIIKHTKNYDPAIDSQETLKQSMEIPHGAADRFHVRHVHFKEFNELCEALKFKKIEKLKMEDIKSVFVKYIKE
jgi:ubiquinone/menaquinone biosynthesis C-methylase UbiE